MPADDIPPSAAGQQATDRRWRVWAAVSVAALTIIAAILGFFILPWRGEDGVSGALGVAHHTPQAAVVATAAPPTSVAWTQEVLRRLDGADTAAGEAAAQRCAGCHGPEGVTPSPAFPSLAGQPATMLYKQLRDFADGSRPSAVMARLAAGLDDQTMAAVAAYYASRAPAPTSSDSTPASPEVARLATHGDPVRGLPACDSCHAGYAGPEGSPTLAGLPSGYIRSQVQAFASGTRGNDIYGLMREVARLVTPEEIEGLAAYYGN